MIIIGLSGPIEHGKSTLAEAVVAINPESTLYIESGDIISEVANYMHANLNSIPDTGDLVSINAWLNNLPPILKDVVSINCRPQDIEVTEEGLKNHPDHYEKLYAHINHLERNPQLAEQTINRDTKRFYRPFLQWLGGYLVMKCQPDIWFAEIVRRINHKKNAGKEVAIVGGLRFVADEKVLRTAGGVVLEVLRPGHGYNDPNDATERERSRIRVDSTVINNGSLVDLKCVAPVIMGDIKKGSLQLSYEAKDCHLGL